MVMYRGCLHSFWHDNPTEPSMREKYQRRIARFNRIDAASQPVLFVRIAATTDELLRAQELLGELQKRFGEQAHLLLGLNFQEAVSGAAFVEGHPKLMIYY